MPGIHKVKINFYVDKALSKTRVKSRQPKYARKQCKAVKIIKYFLDEGIQRLLNVIVYLVY